MGRIEQPSAFMWHNGRHLIAQRTLWHALHGRRDGERESWECN